MTSFWRFKIQKSRMMS